MRLVIPIFLSENRIPEVELKLPTPGVLADVGRAAKAGGAYSAMQVMIAGALENVTDSAGNTTRPDFQRAKILAGLMPMQSAWQTVLQVAKLIKGDGKISGSYECPECHDVIRCQNGRDMDLRDDLDELDVTHQEDEIQSIPLDIGGPIEVWNESGADLLASASKMVFNIPTLNDYLKVSARGVEKSQETFHILNEMLIEVDSQAADPKWKNRYGVLLMKRIPLPRMRELTASLSKFGIKTSAEKVCHKCGSVFTARLNVESFFESALRQEL